MQEDYCYYWILKEEGATSDEAMLNCGCYDCKDDFYAKHGMS